MRSLILLLLGSLATWSLQAQGGCDELFFSEYIEASSNDKALELYNPTAAPIDLSAGNYVIQFYFNGSLTVGGTITLSGVIPSRGTWVVSATNAANIIAQATVNQQALASWFNGDDAVLLRKGGAAGTIIDAIGVLGTDPGTAWTGGSNSTLDRTLRRKPTVFAGDSNPSDAFDPSVEWDGFANNTFTGLGSHTNNCPVIVPDCVISSITIGNISSCDDANTPYTDDDTFTADVIVSYTGAPSMGNLVLVLNGTMYTVAASGVAPGSHKFSVEQAADGNTLSAQATFDGAESVCSFATSLGNAPSPCSELAACSYLFFSEYIEGSSFNKCIEIFNPTNTAINLSSYGVFLSFNGGTFENTIPLSGTIPAGGTYVVCHTSAAADFASKAQMLSGDLNFNGNDVVILEDANGVIDAIGRLGNDATYGMDVTLRRSYGVDRGDNNPNDAFTAATEWVSYPSNTFWGLGSHSNVCKPGTGFDAFNVGSCNTGSVSGTESNLTISNSCFGPGLGDGVTMAFAGSTCGLDLSAQVDVTSGLGKAGLMFRTSLSNGSPYVWIFTQADNRVYFAFRATQNGVAQVNAQFAINVNYMRLMRVGNQFRGMVSANGVIWNTIFQVTLPLANCGFAGAAVHSNVNAATTVATFQNLSYGGPSIQAGNPGSFTADQDQLAPAVTELAVSPNPATSFVHIALAKPIEAEADLTIRDLSGRIVLSRRMDLSAGLSLDLPNTMTAGVYLVSVNTGTEVFTTRLIKQ